MGTKSVCRSFRYSEEVAAIIAEQEGKSENDKFERLVWRCSKELPQTEARLAELQQSIIEKLGKLREMNSIYEQLRGAENKASNCLMQLDRLYYELNDLNKRLSQL